MKAFADLYAALDATTRTGAKVEALRAYFASARPADAAWALYVLTGRRFKRVVTRTELQAAALQATGLPPWMLEECYAAVGDFSETLALLLPDPSTPRPLALADAFTEYLAPMRRAPAPARIAMLHQLWSRLTTPERFIFHKLISGSFRVGVSRTLTVRALAEVAGVPQHEMEHRLLGEWSPTAEHFQSLLAPMPDTAHPADEGSLRPYPFFLAHALSPDTDPAVLGDRASWQAEWKWDGIRAQVIHRAGRTAIWSRGEELISATFPSVLAIASDLPTGTVIDGEILAWDFSPAAPHTNALAPLRGRPLPFAALQRRLNRKDVQPSLFEDIPVNVLAYDLLEREGRDLRAWPTRQRRAALEAIAAGVPGLHVSPVLSAPTWTDLATLRRASRDLGVEGLMLKPLDAPYGVGRTKVADPGDVGRSTGWWKWKIDPYTIDAVLIYAQRGSGRRASLFTDYTFALWDRPADQAGATLVPIATAYSGLTDIEIDQVDAFVRTHTTARHAGSMRTVEPALVFELAFEGLAPSGRHKSGIALRFPRMNRWRTDKAARDADTLDTLKRLLPPGSSLPPPKRRAR